MRKTAMQQMIEWLDMGIDNCKFLGNTVQLAPLEQAKKIATELLETEKNDIIEAYDDGLNNYGFVNTNGSQYYNERLQK